MTDKEKTIKELKETLDSLDITNKYRLNLIRAIEYLQEEPVSEDLEKVARNHLWKDAQGDKLPKIDREVIVLLKGGKVAFAHRPYKGKYLGKSLTTGNIETFENQTYDKGEWNIPNVKYWLNVELPKEIEL